MKRVLYVGNFDFPLGNAAGKRVYANGKILRELGFEVMFIGTRENGNIEESLELTKEEYDNFTYYHYDYPQKKSDWINYKKKFLSLANFLEDNNLISEISLVIYYGSPAVSLFNTELIKYFKNRNIKIVADCSDWLSVKTKNLLFNILKRADNYYQKAYANVKADGVIVVSSFLEKYYKEKKCITTIIPTLSPLDNVLYSESKSRNTDEITLAYAGIPFRLGEIVQDCKNMKDRIDKIIEFLFIAKQNGKKFKFNIYGFTKEQYLYSVPQQKSLIDYIGKSITFYGYVNNEAVVNGITHADFTILIRDSKRETNAGFPTKISESITLGIPVITTDTSDLNKYVRDGETGYFLDLKDEEKAYKKFSKILDLDSHKIDELKDNCLKSKTFHYSNFEESLDFFINKL